MLQLQGILGWYKVVIQNYIKYFFHIICVCKLQPFFVNLHKSIIGKSSYLVFLSEFPVHSGKKWESLVIKEKGYFSFCMHDQILHVQTMTFSPKREQDPGEDCSTCFWVLGRRLASGIFPTWPFSRSTVISKRVWFLGSEGRY